MTERSKLALLVFFSIVSVLFWAAVIEYLVRVGPFGHIHNLGGWSVACFRSSAREPSRLPSLTAMISNAARSSRRAGCTVTAARGVRHSTSFRIAESSLSAPADARADTPTRGPGYLDLSRADEALRNAAKLHLIDNITVYETGAPLPPPRILYARVSLASDRSFTSYEQARAHVDRSSIGTSNCSMPFSTIRFNPTVPNSRSACASTGSGRKSPRHCASSRPAAPAAPRARLSSTAVATQASPRGSRTPGSAGAASAALAAGDVVGHPSRGRNESLWRDPARAPRDYKASAQVDVASLCWGCCNVTRKAVCHCGSAEVGLNTTSRVL